MSASKPIVAIVGRPNVGKSTLLNRVLGRREAIVEEKPGVTRDRKPVDVDWNGRTFTLVDTGGWLDTENALDRQVSLQAERAIKDADLVLMVVDVTVGVTDEDERVARLLRRTDKPVLVVVNKVDSEKREADAWEFTRLGLGDPWGVSALHGRGTGDLLDEVVKRLPAPAPAWPARSGSEGWRYDADSQSAHSQSHSDNDSESQSGRSNVSSIRSHDASARSNADSESTSEDFDADSDSQSASARSNLESESASAGSDSDSESASARSNADSEGASARSDSESASAGSDSESGSDGGSGRSNVDSQSARSRSDSDSSSGRSKSRSGRSDYESWHSDSASDDADSESEDDIPAVAIVGRPNVGKSTLFNRLIGDERSVVHDMPGTTRDTIDTVVETEDGPIRFVDTAGMRRKSRIDEGTEYYSLVRALQAIDRSNAAVLVIDATEGVTHQDQRLAERIDNAGSPVVVLLNKWELLDADRRADVRDQIADRLSFLGYAPVLKVSAKTGLGVHKLLPALQQSIEAYHRRVPTGELNRVIQEAQAAHPSPAGRILYATQGATDPPTFTLFSNKTQPAPYLRYLERKIREHFGFGPTPLKLRVRRRAG